MGKKNIKDARHIREKGIIRDIHVFIHILIQGRPTQVALWAADQLFCHNLGRSISKT
jgi:hypothetical protein